MPMLTSKDKVKQKRKKQDISVRNAIYYDMQSIFDDLYQKSLKGQKFNNLMKFIMLEENIKLAYRTVKKNTGSKTPGTDGLTILDLEKLNDTQLVTKVRNKLGNYNPKSVKRVEIPKKNGKTRPLGIPTIWDRIVQQCLLQILEPICEAKFHKNSNGFRANKSTENAIAQTMKMIQQQHLYYTVDLDIKGFFDNVNHCKLKKQIWNIGIQDKNLICIIEKMLKARIKLPNGSYIQPEKGTPQGGILSPLLANIVLNELDWWLSSQWENFPTKKEYKCMIHSNGTINKAHKYDALRRGSNLKEIFFVRYADDFKIFCKNYKDATKMYHATKMWLEKRLKLEISKEKSKVVNLKNRKSEFLGFTFGTTWKRNKRIVVSHISPSNIKKITDELIELIIKMQKPKSENDLFLMINAYNSKVIGVHNYYQMATAVNIDADIIQKRVGYVFTNRLKKEYNRVGQVPKGYIEDFYGKSKQIRFIHKKVVIPIAYIKTRDAMHVNAKVNKFTEEGRKYIYENKCMNMKVLHALMNQSNVNRSIEYMDNRITIYTAQKGKCIITKKVLELDEIHCHHVKPVGKGGNDKYNNLIIVSNKVHQLIHAVTKETINKLIKELNLDKTQINKVNKYRKLAEVSEINVAI